jgi:hypothetical protein
MRDYKVDLCPCSGVAGPARDPDTIQTSGCASVRYSQECLVSELCDMLRHMPLMFLCNIPRNVNLPVIRSGSNGVWQQAIWELPLSSPCLHRHPHCCSWHLLHTVCTSVSDIHPPHPLLCAVEGETAAPTNMRHPLVSKHDCFLPRITQQCSLNFKKKTR